MSISAETVQPYGALTLTGCSHYNNQLHPANKAPHCVKLCGETVARVMVPSTPNQQQQTPANVVAQRSRTQVTISANNNKDEK